MKRVLLGGTNLRTWTACLAMVCLGLPGCANTSLTQTLQRPAERALVNGMHAYEDGQHTVAERELQLALSTGLAHVQDQATAHKLMGFLQCASQRVFLCEQSFRAALSAQPGMQLSKAEAGHPLWGPVFKRVSAGVVQTIPAP